MRAANRQRLIGLGLLVLLLLILVPWATQPAAVLELHPGKALPEAPSLPLKPPIAAVSQADYQRVDKQISQQRHTEVAQKIDEQAPLRAFSVELSAFPGHADAAKALKALNDAGYHGYVREQQGKFVLFAGPELELSRIKALQKRLLADKKLGYSHLHIKPYRP